MVFGVYIQVSCMLLFCRAVILRSGSGVTKKSRKRKRGAV